MLLEMCPQQLVRQFMLHFRSAECLVCLDKKPAVDKLAPHPLRLDRFGDDERRKEFPKTHDVIKGSRRQLARIIDAVQNVCQVGQAVLYRLGGLRTARDRNKCGQDIPVSLRQRCQRYRVPPVTPRRLPARPDEVIGHSLKS